MKSAAFSFAMGMKVNINGRVIRLSKALKAKGSCFLQKTEEKNLKICAKRSTNGSREVARVLLFALMVSNGGTKKGGQSLGNREGKKGVYVSESRVISTRE